MLLVHRAYMYPSAQTVILGALEIGTVATLSCASHLAIDSSYHFRYVCRIILSQHLQFLCSVMGYRSQQSIRLLKHSPWWVWGGYRTLIQDSTIHPKYLLHPHCENGDYVALNDFAWTYAMWFDSVLDRELRDGEGLTGENSLFPARKPDIDTFGVPRRTRKQRGWYHIHRSPCDLCSHDTTSSHEGTPLSSHAQQYSVASLLPPEIIHLRFLRPLVQKRANLLPPPSDVMCVHRSCVLPVTRIPTRHLPIHNAYHLPILHQNIT